MAGQLRAFGGYAPMTLGENGIYLAHQRSHASAECAERLFRLLADVVPGTPVYLDAHRMFPGQAPQGVSARLVPTSAVLVAILDVGRRQTTAESGVLAFELTLAREHGVPVLPVLLDAGDKPLDRILDDGDREGLLPALRVRSAHLVNDLVVPAREITRIVDAVGVRDSYESTDVRRPLVFVSYSHADRYWLGRVRVHLTPLAADQAIDLWDDTRIIAGDDWRHGIEAALGSAAAAVLIVSADFLASDFIRNDELPPLLEAECTRGLRILPLVVSSSSYSSSPLGRFQAVNRLDRPLDILPRGEQEAELAKLHDAVGTALSTS